jgi:hypothetical protein
MTTLVVLAAAATTAAAQTPQPFPRPGGAPSAERAPAPQTPAAARPPAPAPAQTAPAAPATSVDPKAPTAASLGVPLYPTAQFLASYDAGRGQRYYVFGTTAQYLEIVAFYRKQLDDRGDEVFKMPATHMFDIGRFREETMAFPPSVTVKDWTGGGSQGYPNPKPGGQPGRFPTIIMIVPAPPPAAAPQR